MLLSMRLTTCSKNFPKGNHLAFISVQSTGMGLAGCNKYKFVKKLGSFVWSENFNSITYCVFDKFM